MGPQKVLLCGEVQGVLPREIFKIEVLKNAIPTFWGQFRGGSNSLNNMATVMMVVLCIETNIQSKMMNSWLS